MIENRIKRTGVDALNNDTFRNYWTFSEEGVDLALLECGYEKCDPRHFWAGAKGFHVIHVVLSGKGTVEIGNKEYKVSAGQGFYVECGQEVCYTADEEEPWEYQWLGFLGTRSMIALNMTSLPQTHVFSMRNISRYSRILSDIYDHATLKTEEGEYRSLGLLYLLLADLIEEFSVQKRGGFATEYVNQVTALIRERYSQPLTVNDMCQHINISRSYLYKLFMQCYHMSPSEYLVKFRLEKARAIMDSEKCKVDQLAERTGFNSQAYFTKRFREAYGIPPREYMKRQKKG